MNFAPLSDAAAGPVRKVIRYRQLSTRGIVLFVISLFALIGLGATTFSFAAADDWPLGLTLVAVLSMVSLIGVVVGPIIWARAGRGVTSFSGRLAAFAAANNLGYQAESPSLGYPGTLFAQKLDDHAVDRLYSTTGRFFELGSYRFAIPTVRSRVPQKFGYLAIRLDRALPHILLEANGYGEWREGALPFGVDRSQALSLEGDFDKHFTLYCPEGYERDALYVFTPDVMALLIDHASGSHVEIIEDWLFVYSPRDFEGTSIDEYKGLFRVIEAIEAKASLVSSRYWDARGGEPSQWPRVPGKTLRAGTSPVARAQAWAGGIGVGVVLVVTVVVIVISRLE